MESILNALQDLRYNLQFREAVNLGTFMVIGGLIGLFVRALYVRFGTTAINRDGLSGNFPLLTITTVLVIFIVKSSLALSLGLVGALSIVRFRAAIKEPEELVMLFFCIAAGLALGAEYPELAIGGTAIFAVFMVVRHWMTRKRRQQTLLLTISGPNSQMPGGDPLSIESVLREVVGSFSLQRVDSEGDRTEIRAVVAPESASRTLEVLSALRHRLPGCRISYVDLAGLM